jgi:phosphoribosyl 1,2-cyclic phosphodiesterase
VLQKSENAPRGTDADKLVVCVLASGSKGNAIFISDGSTNILLDAGLSGKEIQRRMILAGLSLKTLTAIIVSHEHTDHLKGVGILSRKYHLPVYISNKTLQAASDQLGKIHQTECFECGTSLKVRTLCLRPFSISHDAADPAGFTVLKNNVKLGIATDLGVATTLVKTHLKGCKALILEANHDLDMLMKGPYPWPLKQRVKSRSGHLSNRDSARLVKELCHDNLSWVILAHMSEANNTAEKALSEIGLALNGTRTHLTVAEQHRPGKLYKLT